MFSSFITLTYRSGLLFSVSDPNNARVAKVLIAAEYNGLQVEEVHIQMGVDNKKPEFLAKFPLGKVPTFESNDGFYLYESNAIAYYGELSIYRPQTSLVSSCRSTIVKSMVPVASVCTNTFALQLRL